MNSAGNLTVEQRELWAKLEVFAFDAPNAKLTFARRLARENGWTVLFAESVIYEYKRFVFLAMEAGHPVSPSEEVDQAWHLHLTYTESYWQGMCMGIFGRRLHHNPTKGGADEAAKFDGQYQETLESYRRLFGETPPIKIWTPAEAREHSKAGGHRWVDTNKHWVIPKWIALAGVAAMGMLLFTLGAAGCSQGHYGIFDLPGPEFIGFFLVLMFGGMILAFIVRHVCSGPHGEPSDGELPADDYETAYLVGGGARVLQTALVSLHADKAIALVPGDEPAIKRADPPGNAQHDIEVLLWGLLPENGSSVTMKALQEGLRSSFEKLEASLAKKNLFSSTAGRAAWWALGIAMIAPVIGTIKIFIGLDRDKPVEILLFLTILSLVLTCVFFAGWHKQRRSGRGSKAITLLRRRHNAKQTTKPDINPVTLPVGTAAALFGLSVLPLYGYDTLADNLKRGVGNTGSGCGSSCGGGGCSGGGGCGGCGGGGD